MSTEADHAATYFCERVGNPVDDRVSVHRALVKELNGLTLSCLSFVAVPPCFSTRGICPGFSPRYAPLVA